MKTGRKPKLRGPCLVEGCGKISHHIGLCNAHYLRFTRHGDPTAGRAAHHNDGRGRIDNGYRVYHVDGRRVGEHVLIAEKVIGHKLPAGAVVHHIDEDRANNTPANLVVCPDAAYHCLLHQRMRAFAASGHYDWRPCAYCKKHDDTSVMKSFGRTHWHHACKLQYQRDWRARRKHHPTGQL